MMNGQLFEGLCRYTLQLEKRVYDSLQQEFGLRSYQVRVMLSLLDTDMTKIGDLTEVANCTSSYLTQMIDSLASKGFVVRVAGETDRRNAYVTLTPEGREFAAKLKETHELQISEIFLAMGVHKGLSIESIATLSQAPVS